MKTQDIGCNSQFKHFTEFLPFKQLHGKLMHEFNFNQKKFNLNLLYYNKLLK